MSWIPGRRALLALAILSAHGSGQELTASDGNWPSFRGTRAAGVEEGFAALAAFDVNERVGTRWKTFVQGLSHASPVIWDDLVFVCTALAESEPVLTLSIHDLREEQGPYGTVDPLPPEGIQRFQVLCFEKEHGNLFWSQTVFEGEPEFPRHPKASFAASTPTVDAERVVASFGSEGLFAFDHDGGLLWERYLGPLDSGYYRSPEAQWGFASSPVLHEGRVIVQCDVLGESFLAVLDARTGEDLWRVPRYDVCTWSTPTVHVGPLRTQIVVNGYKHIGGYDLLTGRELWRLFGVGDIPVPTPIAADGLIYVSGAHERQATFAVCAEASGLVTAEGNGSQWMAWSLPRRGNYMQTPLVHGNEIYLCSDGGVLSCHDARTGVQRYRRRLDAGSSGFTASPVYADGKLYLTSEAGDVYVVRAGPEFELLGIGALGESCMATPAVSEGTIYWRTRSHLVAIGE